MLNSISLNTGSRTTYPGSFVSNIFPQCLRVLFLQIMTVTNILQQKPAQNTLYLSLIERGTSKNTSAEEEIEFISRKCRRIY